MTTPNTTPPALPPLLAERLEAVKERAVTPTSQPVTYGGVVYFDQKSADGARANDQRALRLQMDYQAATGHVL